MNPVIKAQLGAFAKANQIEKHSNETQFEIYSIFSIISGYLGEGADPYDVHLEGDEFGLDGVAILIQGEIVQNRQEAEEKIEAINNPSIEFLFFQSKTGTSYDYGDISKFYDAIIGFFDGDIAGESQAIDDLIAATEVVYEKGIGKKNPKLSCYYVTTGNYEEPTRIEKLKRNFLNELEEKNIFEAGAIVAEFVGARQLQQWYRAATSAVEVEIEFPKNVVLPSNDHVEEAYVGYIDAKNLMRLCTLEDSEGNVIGINRSVFFDNIRDYDPRSKINKSIKQSVRSDGGNEFIFRNNGITVVSKSIDRTGDKFRVEDFQIVNGCQTSNVIYDLIYGEDDAEAISALADSINVPFRLIGSKDDDFVSSIIVGTNRQNPVRDEQFWALRPFMKSFEEYCRGLDAEDTIYFERREHQYRRQDVERTRVMQPAVLMKAVAAALLYQPHRAARDYRGILAEYEETIFLDDHDVRIYHAVCFLHYRLEFLWRNQKLDTRLKTFRYYIIAGLGLSVTKGKNVFSLRKNDLIRVSEQLIQLAKDESALVEAAQRYAGIVENRLKAMSITTPERIRDNIRTETFATAFREKFEA